MTSDRNTAVWYFKNEDGWIKYRIDLKQFIQCDRQNSSEQCAVKRRQIDLTQQEYPREERFHSPPFLISTRSYVGKKALFNLSSSIDACINGILEEAEKHQSHSKREAEWMVEQLKACKTKPRRKVLETCIHLYTRESFLYHALSAALRDADYSKLNTLGPLCFLIRDHSRTCKQFVGTVYRGVELSSTTIELYRKAIGTWRTWPSYTSTSKNKEMADIRGNTLFIVEVMDIGFNLTRAYDIQEISQFPEEEEVLISAGMSFQVVTVEQNVQKKYIIKIKI